MAAKVSVIVGVASVAVLLLSVFVLPIAQIFLPGIRGLYNYWWGNPVRVFTLLLLRGVFAVLLGVFSLKEDRRRSIARNPPGLAGDSPCAFEFLGVPVPLPLTVE